MVVELSENKKLILHILKLERNGIQLGFPNYVELIDPSFRNAGGVD